VVPLLVPWSPISWNRTSKQIAAFGADLLVFRWWLPAFGPAFAAVGRSLRRRGVTVVAAVDNVVPHEAWALARPLSRLALDTADGFIVHTCAVRHQLLDLLPGLDDARIRQVPLAGFPFPSGAPGGRDGARARLGIQERHVLLFFGMVRPYKGLDVLMAAMPHLRSSLGDQIRLVVAGRFFEPVEPWRARIRRAGIDENVTLRPGWVPEGEAADLFAASDLVVVPCHSASQSGVIALAHAQGRPVLTTRVGGLPEMVQEGETGWIVPPGDPEALAEAVLHHFRVSGGETMEAACRRAAERYRPEAQIEAMLDFVPPARRSTSEARR
jgi:glycosyltransferase involved in cell wall biosynthesis